MKLAEWFRWVAIAEASSWLILIVATIIKYTASAPAGVQIMGPIHGVLFIVYVLMALALRSKIRWSTRATLVVLIDSILPTGGFFVARRSDLAALRTANATVS